MQEIQFRKMTIDDVDSVFQIEKACFNDPWSKESISGEFDNPNAIYYVAQIDSLVVGFAGMWIIIDESHITNVAVLEKFRGRGVGQRLMEKLIFESKKHNANSITLEVRKSNILAKSLYEKLGFQDVGLRKNFYSDGEDANIMWNKNLHLMNHDTTI